MQVKELLALKKGEILDQWFEEIISVYSPDAAKIFKKRSDAFANPIGHTIAEEIGVIYDALLGADFDRITPSLEKIIKIRAVQDFTPAKSLAFIFALKEIVKKALVKEVDYSVILTETASFDARIDELALLAFNLYAWSRERLCEVKLREEERKTYMLRRRAGMDTGDCEGGCEASE